MAQARRTAIKSYHFESEGHSIYALTYPSFWVVCVDGIKRYKYENDVAPNTWLQAWQKQKDVEGVYTMLMQMPHTDFPK